jgi:hypothetical protein
MSQSELNTLPDTKAKNILIMNQLKKAAAGGDLVVLSINKDKNTKSKKT